MNNLQKLDLNLLLTLDALLAEHNVTRAAQRLNLSQPSVSVQLAKLRDIFADPLLLAGSRGMQPTTKADALREPLHNALEALEQVISPNTPFDPARANLIWRIAAADYGEQAIILTMLPSLRSQAPYSQLAILELSPPHISKQLEQGEVDLVFHTCEESALHLRRRMLFSEHYVLVSRKNHSHLKATPTLEQFSQLKHVIVSPDGGGFYGATDRALAEVELTRQVVLSVPHFLFVLKVLEHTDLVAMLPSRLVQNHPNLRVFEPPVKVAGFEMAMLWHERSQLDPAHKWLRELIANAIK